MISKKRLTWIDALNIVACAGVLLLHSTNGQIHHFSGTPSYEWFVGLFTHSFFLWPVNVFFMISGFTLIRPSLSVNNSEMGGVKLFYSRRIKRLGIPLLTWNILYMLKYLVSIHIKGEAMETWPNIVEKFILFDFNGFMWFFVPLLLIYLSMPFFSVFVLNANRSLLRLFLIIGLVLGCIPPMEVSFTVKEGLSDIYLMGSRFLFFIVAGYYLGTYDILRKTRRRLYAIALLGMMVMFLGTALLTLYWPTHYRYFISYTNIPCALAAIGVFTFFRYREWDTLLGRIRLSPTILTTVSGLSLGIYLIQGAWFAVLNQLHLFAGLPLLRFLVMYFLCALSVCIMKRVPGVKKIVG